MQKPVSAHLHRFSKRRWKYQYFATLVMSREAWWLSGSMPDCCPAVPGSNPVSPQPTADCQSSGGLPPGMAFGWGLTSVRGNRGENYEKWTASSPKTYKEKKKNFGHEFPGAFGHVKYNEICKAERCVLLSVQAFDTAVLSESSLNLVLNF
jgi:hypothetical protein